MNKQYTGSHMLKTERFKPIPGTNNTYWINIHGEVWDSEGNYVKLVDDAIEATVRIKWMGRVSDVTVAVLTLIVFDDIELPATLWDLIDPIYKDGNRFNPEYTNLAYCFHELAEHEEFSGYYYIPYYTRYCISEGGEIINAQDGRVKSWYTARGGHKNATGGYKYTRVKLRDYYSNLGRHRALCLVFKPYTEDPANLIVNHLDGVPGNDHLDNLEWSTHAKNNQHAYDLELRPNAARAVLMKNIKTGVVTRFESISACGRALGYPTGSNVEWRMRCRPDVVYPDFLLFKWDDDSEWPEVEAKVTGQTPKRVMEARNVHTGEITRFTGLPEGSKITGICRHHLSSLLRGRSPIPFMGFNFRYVDEGTPWPKHTEYHLKIYKKYPKSPPNGVFVKDIQTGEETFYCSPHEVMEAMDIPKGVLSYYRRTGELYKNRYVFRTFKLKESLGLPQE